MHLDRDSDKDHLQISSWCGSMSSILLFLLIGTYAVQKFDVLLAKEDVDLMTNTLIDALTFSDEFYPSMGFNIAAGYTAYDGTYEPIDDPTVGELVFNSYRWGKYSNDTYYSGRERIEAHRCSTEELGLDQSSEQSDMFPMSPNFV